MFSRIRKSRRIRESRRLPWRLSGVQASACSSFPRASSPLSSELRIATSSNSDSPSFMYRWRKLTPEQREKTLEQRKLQKRPRHSPPHHREGNGLYLVTATCYEHRPWIGSSDGRMDEFSGRLVELLQQYSRKIDAWVVLPNHYHAVVSVESCPVLIRELGKLHGRSSFLWNKEDGRRGRKVWFNAVERSISTDAHHIAAIHYVHHNPVKHGHVKKWDEWKWSSAVEYLERLGRDEVERRWREYPLMNFGSGWDD